MAQSNLHILAIPGSLRRDSYNKALLRSAAELAPNGITIEVYEHLDEVPLLNEDVSDQGTPAGVESLRRAVASSDAILISTPEYNQAVPGVLKNAIDWLSLGEPHEGFEGKPVAVTGVTTGPWGTRLAQTMLRQMLVSTQAILLPQPFLYLREARSLFDETGRLTDATTRRRLSELVLALGEWVEQLNRGQAQHDGLGAAPHRSVSVYAAPGGATTHRTVDSGPARLVPAVS